MEGFDIATVGSLVVQILAQTKNFEAGAKRVNATTAKLSTQQRAFLQKEAKGIRATQRLEADLALFRKARAAERFAQLSRNQKMLLRVNVATKALVASSAALAAVAIPIAIIAGLKAMITAQEKLEQSMQRSLAIMGDVSEHMREEMTQAAIDLSKVTVFSSREIADSFFFLASTGLTAEQSLESLSTVATFAQAGMFDMAKATELLGGAQAALGLTVEDTQQNLRNMVRVGNALVQANVQAQATVEEFSEALTTKSAAAMKFFGIRVEEGIAVLAAFAKQNKKGAEGGTAFDIVLRELTIKAVTFEEKFKKAGIAVFDATGNLRPFADILLDVEKRLEGMSDKGKTAELMLLGFSAKSISNLRSLVGMSEAIRKWTAEQDAAGDVMQRVADKQMTALEKAWESLKGEISDTGQVMAPFIEDLASFINLAGEWVKGANAMAAALGDLAGAVSGDSEVATFVSELLELTRFGPIGALGILTRAPSGPRPFEGGIPLPPAPVSAAELATARGKAELLIQEERAAKAGELAEKVEKLTARLREQVEVFGMSAAAAEIWKLKQEGAGDAALQVARDIAKQLDALKKNVEEQKKFNARVEDAKRITDSVRTPLDKYKDTVSELKDLFFDMRVGFSDEGFNRAMRDAQIQLLEQTTRRARPAAPRPIDVASAARGTQAGFAAQFGRQQQDRLKGIFQVGKAQLNELKGIRDAIIEQEAEEAIKITVERL